MVPSSAAVKMVGDSARYLSLACCVSFWVLFALYYLIGFRRVVSIRRNRVLEVMGVAVVLAIVSLIV